MQSIFYSEVAIKFVLFWLDGLEIHLTRFFIDGRIFCLKMQSNNLLLRLHTVCDLTKRQIQLTRSKSRAGDAEIFWLLVRKTTGSVTPQLDINFTCAAFWSKLEVGISELKFQTSDLQSFQVHTAKSPQKPWLTATNIVSLAAVHKFEPMALHSSHTYKGTERGKTTQAANTIIHSIWPFYAKYLICEPNKNTVL